MIIDRRTLCRGGLAAGALAAVPRMAIGQGIAVAHVDVADAAGALDHVWSECAGSDRAAITMRESWRRDLDRWRTETGLKRVRFHGILNDELGILASSIQNRGKTDVPNWQNVDRVYDGLIEHGVSPFVELSFMPQKLASGSAAFGFYKGNITPPKSVDAWGAFIHEFVAHLVERYGLAAVRTWPFEVWNEPNLPFFWTGNMQQYLDMYKATAVAIKSVDQRLLVGGPSTSTASWVAEFAQFCELNNAPCDFVSTHAYAADDQVKMFGVDRKLSQADVIPAAVERVRQQMDASILRGRPLWFSEWSSDSPAVIAHVVSGCLPHVRGMSHWTMSSTYEELGVLDFVLQEGDTGYGAMVQQIAKPAFNTYKLMHSLGTTRLRSTGPVLASRRSDGSTAAMVWNLADVQAPSGIPGVAKERTVSGAAKQMTISFANARPGQHVRLQFVDQERGSPMPMWRRMGSPRYPTLAQIAELRRGSEIPVPTHTQLDANCRLNLMLPPEGVALVELV